MSPTRESSRAGIVAGCVSRRDAELHVKDGQHEYPLSRFTEPGNCDGCRRIDGRLRCRACLGSVIRANHVGGALFYIAGAAKWTDGNGIATGAPSAGWRTVRVNGTTASYYVGSYVVCTDQYNGNTLYNGLADGTTVWIYTTAGHLTICDWYLLY